MFQLKTPTNVTLLHINVRTERHGNEDVDAYDLDFSLTGQNTDVLALLHPALCEVLYHDAAGDDGQETAPGVPKVLPDLRFPKLASFAWPLEGTGYDLCFVYGLGDDKSNIPFESGKAVSKRVENAEGGTSALFFRYSTSSMPDGALDKLRKKLKQQVTVTLVQPEKLRNDAVIDGTVGHPGAAAAAAGEAGPDATDLFAAGAEQPAEPQRGENWPFGTNSGADGTVPHTVEGLADRTPPATEPKSRRRKTAAAAH